MSKVPIDVRALQEGTGVAVCAWALITVLQLLSAIAFRHLTGYLLLYYLVLIVVCTALGGAGAGAARGDRWGILVALTLLLALAANSAVQGTAPAFGITTDLLLAGALFSLGEARLRAPSHGGALLETPLRLPWTRRALAIATYWVNMLILVGIGVRSLGCSQAGRCSSAAEHSRRLLEMTFEIGCMATAVLGWVGRLPGTRIGASAVLTLRPPHKEITAGASFHSGRPDREVVASVAFEGSPNARRFREAVAVVLGAWGLLLLLLGFAYLATHPTSPFRLLYVAFLIVLYAGLGIAAAGVARGQRWGPQVGLALLLGLAGIMIGKGSAPFGVMGIAVEVLLGLGLSVLALASSDQGMLLPPTSAGPDGRQF